MRSRAIYYGGDIEGINGKGRNIKAGQDDRKDGRYKVQLFIYTSNALFADNSINRKSL